MTAVQCIDHSWMKARKTTSTNLNSSTSSLDSALCMDSASSMEPSPVSSASSSFSPAPSTTTRSTSSTVSTTSSSFSQPEDMKKVNEKLKDISTLATERLIADSAAAKARGEGSPTSTNSSTSTLKGDESAENIPSLVQEQQNSSLSSSSMTKKDATPTKDVSTPTKIDSPVKKEPLAKKDSADGAPVSSGHSRSFEGPMVITRSYGRYDSATLDRRSKTPLTATTSDGSTKDYLSRSYTLDRRRETAKYNSSKSVERDPSTSTSASTSTALSSTPTGRTGRSLSKAAEDLLALDPKTIQSLEKLKKLTAGRKSPRPKTPDPPRSPSAVSADVKRLSPHVHRRPTTPEPQAPPVTDVKLLHSPERRRRRKSEGMHPIEKQAGANFVPCEGKTLHEGDELEQEQENEKEVEKEEPVEKPKDESKDVKATDETKRESSKPVSEERKKDSPSNKPSVGDSEADAPMDKEPTKTTVERTDSKLGSSGRSQESKVSIKKEISESKKSPSPVKEVQRSVSPPKADKEVQRSVSPPKADREVQRSVSPPKADKEVQRSVTPPQANKEVQRSVSPSSKEASKPSDVEAKPATPTASTSARSKVENGDRSPSPKKRISSSSSNEDSNTGSSNNRSVTISSFTRSPIDRIWSDFKKEDSSGGSNGVRTSPRTSPRSNRYQNSSQDSLNDNTGSPNRRRFVTRERYLDDGRTSFKIKPTQDNSGRSPQTSRSTSPTKNQSTKEDVKSPPTSATKSSAPVEFGTCYSLPRTKSPPGVTKSDSFKKKNTTKPEEAKVTATKPEETPCIVLQPPKVDESSKGGGSSPKVTRRDIRVRQKSPVSDVMKQIKANRRKTPVISEDALAAILSGDIPDEEIHHDDATCPLSPSQVGDRRMTLETCLEEDEEPKQYFSSPPRSGKNASPNSSTSSERTLTPQQQTPEKRVTISSEPCIRRVGKRHTLIDMRERTKSLTSFSPERSLSPTSPRETETIPEEGELPNNSNLLNLPMSRLRASSLVMSRSTPDLSEILGPKKKDRKARRIERSNSKRRVKGDGYVTSTTPNSIYNPLQSSNTHTATRSSSRILSGSRISKFTSAFSRKDKDRNEKDISSSKHSDKSSKRW